LCGVEVLVMTDRGVSGGLEPSVAQPPLPPGVEYSFRIGTLARVLADHVVVIDGWSSGAGACMETRDAMD
jgi:hypothetical protein